MRIVNCEEMKWVGGAGDDDVAKLGTAATAVVVGAYNSPSINATIAAGRGAGAGAAAAAAGTGALTGFIAALGGAGYLGYQAGSAIYNNSETVRGTAAEVMNRVFGDPGEAACVHIHSRLPCGKRAGEIRVGDEMQLGDATNFSYSTGIVSYSQEKRALGYRITTVSGASLVCSGSAPIPTPQGLVLAPAICGKQVAVRRDDPRGEATIKWDVVEKVEAIGEISIQHITVGDKCFWAGESKDAYILHHNKSTVSTTPSGTPEAQLQRELDPCFVIE